MGKRFDDLSKAFATGVSRRQALLGALGGVGAAVAAAVVPGRGAEADVNSATRCAAFCESYCGDPSYFTNGRVGHDPCTDDCIAEASMYQGPCYTTPGAPMFKASCDYSGVCPGNQVCCNGRCCLPDLCVTITGFANLPSPITNGTNVVLLPPKGGPGIADTDICLGCGKPPAFF